MTNFDIPNEQELQPDVVYNYDLVGKEYPITENNSPATYNQFIQLRDTFIHSEKKYPWKAGKKLIVWEKMDGSTTNTIEIAEEQRVKLSFNQDYRSGWYTLEQSWKYLNQTTWDLASTYWPLSIIINKSGRYRIVHKEQVLPQSSEYKVYTYVDHYRKVWNTYVSMARGWIAVFDVESSWTLRGTTSGTDPNGSCSVSFRLWQLFQKMTAFGYIEKELEKDDVLVLRMRNAAANSPWVPWWWELKIQADSNYWTVEYLYV